MSTVCYPPGLIGVDEAVERLLAAASTKEQALEMAPLSKTLGRVLAQDITASVDVPPRDNSAMDGIAIRFTDTNADGDTTLRISQRIPAGAVSQPLAVGTAARIFTGAELPEGADTVVMQEDCVFAGDSVTFKAVSRPRENVRPQGQDIAKGSLLLPQGQRLGPAHIGLLASVGQAQVPVFKSLTVALFSTGDELVEPGRTLGPGQIYNSNRYTLTALLKQFGCQVLDLGMVPDRLDATIEALRNAELAGADLIISSGGVSVGEEDHVKGAVEALGAIDLWKVAIKPGKPLAFGRVGQVPFIGLPGNPQSVWVTFLLLARPYLLRLQGQGEVLPRAVPVPAGFEIGRVQNRREYLRVRLVAGAEGLVLEKHGNQSSGVLSSSVWADGLALIEAETAVKKGALLPFFAFSSLLMA